jgi:hypothetical protein
LRSVKLERETLKIIIGGNMTSIPKINSTPNAVAPDQEAYCIDQKTLTPYFSNIGKCPAYVPEYNAGAALQNQAKRFGAKEIVGTIVLGAWGCGGSPGSIPTGSGTPRASEPPTKDQGCVDLKKSIISTKVDQKLLDEFNKFYTPVTLQLSPQAQALNEEVGFWTNDAGEKINQFTPNKVVSVVEDKDIGRVFALVGSDEGPSALLAYQREDDGSLTPIPITIPEVKDQNGQPLDLNTKVEDQNGELVNANAIPFTDRQSQTQLAHPAAMKLSDDGTELQLLFGNDVIKLVNPSTLEVDNDNANSNKMCKQPDGGVPNDMDGGTPTQDASSDVDAGSDANPDTVNSDAQADGGTPDATDAMSTDTIPADMSADAPRG